MSSEQLQGLADFKKRAKANVIIPRKPSAPSFERTLPKASNLLSTKPRSFNYNRFEEAKPENRFSKIHFVILAKVIRYLRNHHLAGEDQYLSIDEILDETNQLNVCGSTRKWLANEALINNPKIEFTPEKTGFRFKPKYRIKDGKALIRLLKQHDLKGLGGIDLDDLKESLPNCDAFLRKYDNEILTIARPKDKKKFLFYNDKTADFDVDEEFKRMWRMVPVDCVDESKIEEHLEKHGIRALQGEKPKIRIQKRSNNCPKRKRLMEKTRDNVHVASVLESYDERGFLTRQ